LKGTFFNKKEKQNGFSLRVFCLKRKDFERDDGDVNENENENENLRTLDGNARF
jgi:hypothetical protein